jgi:hypothetical protein
VSRNSLWLSGVPPIEIEKDKLSKGLVTFIVGSG